jgi:hypothetical protein
MPDEDNNDIISSDYDNERFALELAPDLREIIAQAIHEAYRHAWRPKIGNRDLSAAPWDKLPDYLKESNRQQADHIFDKLRQISCTVYKVTNRDIIKIKFTKDEIEAMAEMEHTRWSNERFFGGWRLGKKRDVIKKYSPYLVSWAELPDEIKEWDRQVVRKIPELLARVGLEIRRDGWKGDVLAESKSG